MSKEKPNYNEIIFTENQEKEIIDMYLNQNLSTVKIGKLFNCGNKVIGRVLERNNIPRTGVGQRKYALNEHYFDIIDTQEKAYILGFFYADGCNFKPKSTVSMSLQEDDVEILEKIRLEIQSEKPLEYLNYSNKHDFGYTYKNQYRLQLFSSYMCNTLESIGMIPNKSLQLQFPNISEKLYSHFIRGYFDGDGSVYFADNGNCVVTITSTDDFCRCIKNIVEHSLKIHCTISNASNNNGITKVLSISGKYQVETFFDWIYEDANLYLKRKHQKYIDKYYPLAS